MRVISGVAKGRKLRSVPGDTTRPITDRVKEALFNIVAGDALDSTWWDVFAGTGAVGIEALSRGAAFARFTDLNRAPLETIEENLQITGLHSRAEVRRADAFTMLGGQVDRKFDYIYLAPPQYQDMWSKALQTLDRNLDWLAESAWVVVQLAPKEFRGVELLHLQQFDERKYGTTLLAFYGRGAE